jgi:hypothetical protein
MKEPNKTIHSDTNLPPDAILVKQIGSLGIHFSKSEHCLFTGRTRGQPLTWDKDDLSLINRSSSQAAYLRVGKNMKTRRLILFSGMGADGRLLQRISIPEAEIIAPDHTEPLPGETLPHYAARIADIHKIQPVDIVGGVSSGGMSSSTRGQIALFRLASVYKAVNK